MEMITTSEEMIIRELEIRRKLEEMTLMDDLLMSKVFESKEVTEEVLKIILQMDDLQVIQVTTQKDIKNLQGKSIRIDVHATNQHRQKFTIEVQVDPSGASFKRARYISSIVDANILDVGAEYKNLPNHFVIFITETDVIGKNYPIYHIDRTIRETGDVINDGSHIIYVNSSIQDDTELGRLMFDFHCKSPRQMHSKKIANKIKYFKEESGGRYMMYETIKTHFSDELNEAVEKLVKIREQKLKEELTVRIRQEVINEVTAKVTDEVTARVTDEVTARVTDEVTVKVTDEVTKSAANQIHQDDILRMHKLGLSNDQISTFLDIPESIITQVLMKQS